MYPTVYRVVQFQEALVKTQGQALSFGSLLNSSKTDARSLVLIRPYRVTIEAWLPNTERACFDEVHWLD